MENNLNKDFWLQFVASMARKALILVGTLLVQHGWVSQQQTDSLTSLEAAQYVAGGILFIIPVGWAYAKQTYNVHAIREALAADRDTPVEVIKSETLSKHSIISSV